jgi:hypothetical protein
MNPNPDGNIKMHGRAAGGSDMTPQTVPWRADYLAYLFVACLTHRSSVRLTGKSSGTLYIGWTT